MFNTTFKKKIILSFDVEDNFTKNELTYPSDWEKYESQVVENTKSVIRLLREINADASFFVVGKTAERHPEMIQMIDQEGFEVASHGYAHELTDRFSPDEFRNDVRRSMEILQEITGKPVHGYRARSFSITRNTLWALPILEELGIAYDSSMTDVELSALTGKGPEPISRILNHKFQEIPVSTCSILGRATALSGGIAFRLTPYSIYKILLRQSASFACHPMIYCHVWEFNKDQPQRRVNLMQKLAQGAWTYTTEAKIRKLSENYDFISVTQYLEQQTRYKMVDQYATS